MVVQTFIVYTVEETQKNIIERMTQKIVIFCASRPIKISEVLLALRKFGIHWSS